MLRTILSIILGIVAIGLGVALLNAFDWDIGALFTWAWNLVAGLIEGIADWFYENPFFRRVTES